MVAPLLVPSDAGTVLTVAVTHFLPGSFTHPAASSGECYTETMALRHHEGCLLDALMVASVGVVGLLDTNNGSPFRLITLWNPLLIR